MIVMVTYIIIIELFIRLKAGLQYTLYYAMTVIVTLGSDNRHYYNEKFIIIVQLQNVSFKGG